MKPYYQTELGSLYCGDCIEIMNEISDGNIDLILTDPPYGISSEMKITRTRNTMKFKSTTDLSANFGDWDKFETIKDYLDYTFNWINISNNKLRNGGMFISFFDRDKINFISHYLQNKNYKQKGYFAFIKSNPVPQARKVKWMNAWEEAILLQKPNGKLTYNYKEGQHPDYVIHSICSGKERTKHPTQKPLKIIEPFIRWWTKENDLILDPFVGSGTTAVVCEKLNRRWIGCEISKEYCDITIKRVNNEIAQGKLNFSER